MSSTGSRLAMGAVCGLGVAAEVVVGDAQPLRVAAGDLVAGAALGIAGAVAMERTERAWTGRWLALAGVLWFLATLATSRHAAPRSLGDGVGLAYRGALVTAVLCACCRMRSPLVLGVAAAGWVDGTLLDGGAGWSIALAALVIVAAVAAPRGPRLQAAGLLPAACLALALGGPAAVVALGQTADPGDRVLLGGDLAIALTAIASVRPGGRAEDRILELAAGGGMQGALAHVLGDPRVRVLEPAADLRAAPAGRERTSVAPPGGGSIAVVEHEAGALDDPALRRGLSTAIALQHEHDLRRAAVRSAAEEIRRSQRRMLVAAEQSREGLQRRLEERAIPRALAIRDALASADATAEVALAVTRAVDELRALVIGLHPPLLRPEGLAGAIGDLARASPVPVTAAVDDRRHPEEIELVVYFACAEALTNAAKHAGASHIDVTVACDDDRVVAEVADDGIGGAALAPTSAIFARVAAVDGRVTLRSPPGDGTTVRVEVPL